MQAQELLGVAEPLARLRPSAQVVLQELMTAHCNSVQVSFEPLSTPHRSLRAALKRAADADAKEQSKKTKQVGVPVVFFSVAMFGWLSPGCAGVVP